MGGAGGLSTRCCLWAPQQSWGPPAPQSFPANGHQHQAFCRHSHARHPAFTASPGCNAGRPAAIGRNLRGSTPCDRPATEPIAQANNGRQILRGATQRPLHVDVRTTPWLTPLSSRMGRWQRQERELTRACGVSIVRLAGTWPSTGPRFATKLGHFRPRGCEP